MQCTLKFINDRSLLFSVIERYVVHVVIRLMGAGDAFVRCMFRISFARPNFHSVSDSRCRDKQNKFYLHLTNIGKTK